MKTSIQRSDEPFPLAYTSLAEIYFDISEFGNAWDAATTALEMSDDHEFARTFSAQLIRLFIAYVFTKEAELIEFQKGAAKLITNHLFSWANSKPLSGDDLRWWRTSPESMNYRRLGRVFDEEIDSNIKLYIELCNSGSSDEHMIRYTERLLHFATEGMRSDGTYLQERNRILQTLASASIDANGNYSDEAKRKHKTLTLIAEGSIGS